MTLFSIKTNAALLLIFLTVSFSAAQNPVAKKRLNDAGGGYSFLPPEGFEAKQSEEGFALTDAAKSVIVIVKTHNYQNFQKFAEQANLEKDGFTLIDKVKDWGERNKAFRASKQTAQGVLVADTFVLFSPFGGGAMVVALSDSKNAENGFKKGLEISSSVSFSKPATSSAGNQLENAFRGKHLLYLYTANGFSERTDIYLCPSGSFIYRTDSSSLSANGSGVIASNTDGNWKILSFGNTAGLVLQFNNGTTRQYMISARQAANEIGLNGKRFFVQNQTQCR